MSRGQQEKAAPHALLWLWTSALKLERGSRKKRPHTHCCVRPKHMELSASAQGDARIVAARSLPRSVAHLDRALLFQIFDYLRDGRAFLQFEATCVDFRSLLREDGDTIGQIGQKLWQARPIAYGARIFATGGTAYTEEESYDVDEQYWAGTVGWAEHSDREICDGGREVVLGFACMDAIGAAQRLHGAIIAPLAGEQWTPLANRLHRWENSRWQRPLDTFPSDVVRGVDHRSHGKGLAVLPSPGIIHRHR